MKRKNNNGVLVGFLIGIIIALIIVIMLFATKTINFNNSSTNNNQQKENNNESINNQDNESIQIQDELGKNDTFSSNTESGVVEVIGYTETKEIIDEIGTGEKYNYIFFHIKETKSEEFKKYIESLQGNSFVGNNTIGLGCIINNKIKYYNHSDVNGATEYELSDEVSNKILNSTETKPIKLKLERLALSYGKGAPICYSHITKIEIAN